MPVRGDLDEPVASSRSSAARSSTPSTPASGRARRAAVRAGGAPAPASPIPGLDLARRSTAGEQRAHVAAQQPRRVPPAHAGDGGHGAHADAEVVAPAPVPEVVPCAKVAPARPRRSTQKKFAVSYQRQPAAVSVSTTVSKCPSSASACCEGSSVGVRELRSRLRLELVAGGARARATARRRGRRRDRRGCRRGCRTAGRARRCRIRQREECAGTARRLDVVRAGALRSSTRSRCGRKLCAPSDTRFTRPRRRSCASSGVTVSGFASTVSSSAAGERVEEARELGRVEECGRPAPEEDRGPCTLGKNVGLERELREQRVDVLRVAPAPPDDGHEVAVAATAR